MKIVKAIAITFVFSIVLACMNVQADDTLALLDINIPALGETYTSPNIKKTVINNQYVSTVGTTPERAVIARVNSDDGDHGTYHNLAIGGCSKVTGTDGIGYLNGTYNLNIKTKNYHITSTSYSGNWLLDGSLRQYIC